MPSDYPLDPDAQSSQGRQSVPGAAANAGTVPLAVRRSPGRRRRSRLIGILLSSAVAGSAVFSMSAATAAPRPTLKEVEAKVTKLQAQAEQASEDYNLTKEKLKSLKVRLSASQGQLTRQHAEVEVARERVGRLAAETYRHGQLGTLDLMFGDDPDLALAQAGYLPTLANRRVGAMTRLKSGEDKLAATQAQMKEQQTAAQAAQDRLKTTQSTVKKKLAEAEDQIAQLKGNQQAELVTDQNNSDSAGVPAGAGSSAACNARAANAPSAAARTAIRFGCDQLGDSYLWAADGPSRWDCSGLTMKAYAAAGVSLPHSSAMQATYGTRVSVGALKPGDLVFFHSPISHVGIYIGDGLMLHAPHSGSVVQVASLYETPSVAVRL